MITSDYVVGEKVRITQTIIDDGSDYSPPMVIARKGEIVEIVEIYGSTISVRHEDAREGASFVLFKGEYCPTFEQ